MKIRHRRKSQEIIKFSVCWKEEKKKKALLYRIHQILMNYNAGFLYYKHWKGLAKVKEIGC